MRRVLLTLATQDAARNKQTPNQQMMKITTAIILTCASSRHTGSQTTRAWVISLSLVTMLLMLAFSPLPLLSLATLTPG